MSAREVGAISHMHGNWDITIREFRSLFRRRRHYEIACDRCGMSMAGTSSSDEAWQWAYDHSNWHAAQRSAEGAYDGLDDLTRAELPEMPKAVSDTLDEWLWRMHGIASGGHHVGVFLEWLHRNGYCVAQRSAEGAHINEGDQQ